MLRSSGQRSLLIVFSTWVLLFTPKVAASSLGHLSGVITDESGHPIGNVLVALLEEKALQKLPFLTQTDDEGEIHFRNVEAGDYKVLVKSSRYRGPNETIRVHAGRTSVVTLVLQQFLQLNASKERNLSVKTLLRMSGDRRLIFRNQPHVHGEHADAKRPESFFENAVFQVYSSASLDGDYFVFPGDSVGGMTSNFAMVEPLGGNGKYVLAGQLNSGQDSIWRLKSLIELPVSDFQSMQLSVGYSRLSFDQPSLALLNNPALLGDDLNFTTALGTTKILTIGLSDRLHLGETVSLLWGLELNRVQMNQTQTFINPNVELSYSPSEKTNVRLVMASKRHSQGNSLMLPDGGLVTLNDAVYFSRVGNNFNVGTSRYYLGSVSQRLNRNTEIELATYNNQLFGRASPLMALLPGQGVQVWHLSDDQVNSHGYRVTVRRSLNQNLTTSVSYIRGNATGLNPEPTTLLPGESDLHTMVDRSSHQAVSTEFEAYIPCSQTRVKALVKYVPDGYPIPTLDTFSDSYDTGNQGINFFVRQSVPVPVGLLSFVGLDFLAAYEIEALLDIRNLTNENLAKISTASGDLVLLRNPRTVRGGIAFRF